jgi:endonuclease YncB( thermonuclease family)
MAGRYPTTQGRLVWACAAQPPSSALIQFPVLGLYCSRRAGWRHCLPAWIRSSELGGGERVSDRTQIPSRPNATAIDGDSLRLGDREIRLLGIDAPELFQTCRNEQGGEWACGREARSQLSELLFRDMVDCVSKAKDRYGRTLATCSAGSVADIGEAMVRAGYAVNFMSGGYQAAEAAARAEKRCIWRGAFERPQEWRRRNARSD